MVEPGRDCSHCRCEDPGDDCGLRSALSSLKPFLTKLGLIPSRLAPYIPPSGDCRCDAAYKYLNESIRQTVVQHEAKQELEVAVLFFVDQVLDDKAPSLVLPCFMHALYLANKHPKRPNEDAWRVHDILRMVSFYAPLQQALVDFAKDRQRTDLHGLLSKLVLHRLLQPTAMGHVLEALEQEDGVESAVACLLAFVYDATILAGIQPRLNLRRRVESLPVWLETLLQCVERWGNQECRHFRKGLPPSVLSADGWETVCEKLVSTGQQHRIRENREETQSEAGDSETSDFTVVSCDNYNEESRRKTNSADQKFLGRNVLDVDQVEVQEIRQQRTAQYVLDSNEDVKPQVCLELVDHSQPSRTESAQLRSQYGAAWQSVDRDENSTVITEVSSTSTENNSHVVGPVSLVDRGREDPMIRDLARTLGYIGLSDRLDSGPGQITLHAYQKELLQYVKDGKNVAIFLPTGTGKTFIVFKYVQEYLSRPGAHKRVVFLAPKVKLVEQQYRRFRYFFPHTTYFRTGKSRSCSAPFSELINIYQVFVMTPMCLVEVIQRGEVKITDFSVLILDECHHTRGKHGFKALMDVYMDAKFKPVATDSPRSPLPQVIGLTASPGVGRGDTLENAVTYVRDLCFSMDVEKIGTVKINVDDLNRFINEPKHEIHTCKERIKNNFKRIIEGMMKTIERDMLCSSHVDQHKDSQLQELLRKVLTAPDLHRGLLRYTRWVCGLNKQLIAVADDNLDAYTMFFSSAEMLQKYQRCLIINEDCESRYALQYLLENVSEMEEALLPIDKQLLMHLKAHLPELERACSDSEDSNPKLRMLEDILLTMIDKNQDQCACMVFVRTIELSLALQRWIQGHRDLKMLNPGRIIGTGGGRMTQSEVSDVLEKFNKGDHQLVVCTSAAEEGLDFQACNVVVRYDYVASMIAMIQSRGRARRMDSQYCVLGNHTQGSVDKEKGNLAAERLMKKAIEEVQNRMDQNANAFLHQMNQSQETEWRSRCCIAEHTRLKRRLVGESAPTFQLLCRKCQSKACLSSDLRLLGHSNRLVIAADFKSKWKRVEQMCRPNTYQFNLEKIARVRCKSCSHDWGCVVKHKPSDTEYPLLKLESFVLLDTSTNKKKVEKLKWANAPFNVMEITDDELMELATKADRGEM